MKSLMLTLVVSLLEPSGAWEESLALEARGDLAGALALIDGQWRQKPSARLALRRGWLSMQQKRYDRAATAYEDALALSPDSEDAWLGLQWARISREDWSGAAAAGQEALARAPNNAWAAGRHGLTLFMLGEYEDARRHYIKALAAQPENGEFHLGMGYTLARMGEAEASRAACHQARKHLGPDPRVASCLRSSEDEREVWATVSVSRLGYSGAYASESLQAYTVAGGASLSPHWLFWVGNTASTLARQGEDAYNQVAPILTVGWRDRQWSAGASVVPQIFANEDAVDGTRVLIGRGGLSPSGGSPLGADVSLAWTSSPGDDVLQLHPMLRYAPSGALTLGIGPEVQLFPEEAGGVAVLMSGHLELDWRLSGALTARLAGYAGPRRYPVSSQGLSVWTGGERFTAGGALGLDWGATDWLTLGFNVTHDIGDEQYGLSQDFSITGGTLILGVGW